jgi:hypothetical protein
MARSYLLLVTFFTALLLYSCSKKSHPSRSGEPANNSSAVVKSNDSLLAKKAPAKRKEKIIIPKVITVNDSAAHKSVDGRLYYDVMGHRYWRSNKDGKYYLFNKSMYTDDAFKKP